jgi:hypothetical protein
MKKLSLTLLIITGALFYQKAQAQQTDSLKQVRVNWLSKELSITKEKAQQISLIMDQYKASANLAINDKSLNEETLRTKINQLIDEKNTKLKQLLTEEQSNKLIPTTERKRN